jgi:predicted TIM-barrel fold metal-dependent hydrolase
MVERDADGGWLTLNDPAFDPVMARIAQLGVPLIAHQAEPLNAWLPLEQMTTENDRSYFAEHPQYHMYLHPDQPAYELLIAQRNQFVARHPEIPFVGAHLASVEWSVDRIARFLDAYPNAVVDMAARMTQLQYQSVRDRPRVRRFMIQYQDRILYGSDLTADPGAPPAAVRKEARDFWRSDWRYLATQDTQTIAAIKSRVPGLALPREVVRKIFFDNAQREFLTPAAARAAERGP